MHHTAVMRSCECLDLHKLLCVADVYVLIIINIQRPQAVLKF